MVNLFVLMIRFYRALDKQSAIRLSPYLKNPALMLISLAHIALNIRKFPLLPGKA